MVCCTKRVRVIVSSLLQTLLKTTNHIMVHDVQASLGLLCSLSHHGMAATTSCCTLCNRPVALSNNNDAPIEEVAVFRCVCSKWMCQGFLVTPPCACVWLLPLHISTIGVCGSQVEYSHYCAAVVTCIMLLAWVLLGPAIFLLLV